MTRVYLEGYEIEVADSNVRQTFQRNKLNEISTRQLNFTNTFKAYHTIKNTNFFGYIDEINSNSDKPYRLMDAKIVVDGYEVVQGSAYIKRSKNEEAVEIYIYSGINGIYEAINNKSIRSLDYSSINHTISESIVTNSFNELQPYIYGFANRTNKVNEVSKLDTWLPSVYEYWLFDKIITEAGFTYEGDLFQTAEFKKPVINAVNFDELQPNLLIRDFETFLPDILQTEFIRDIMARYGLMFDLERGTNNLVFKQIKDVFKDRANAVDWSEKYVTKGNTEFTLGSYATRNYIRYQDKEGYSKNADGFFELDIDNLAQTTTVYSSVYTVNQALNRFDTLVFPIYNYDDAEEVSLQEVDASISTIEKINGSFLFSTEAGGTGGSFTGDIPYLRFIDLDMQGYINDNYQELKKIANRAKVIDAELFLDPIDIYNLDFFKLIYIQELQSNFYVNRVSNFIEGKSTICELVRIPPNVFSDNTITNTAPVVELFADKISFNQGELVTFTHNVSDGENNIEKWELIFDGVNQVSGFGVPPQNIQFTYQNPGTFNPVLIVTDFEEASGQDSIQLNVIDTFVVTFDNQTGLYTAPPGSTVIVTGSIGGSSDGESIISAGTGDVPIGNAAYANLGSFQLAFNIPSSPWPSTGQFSFVVPASGQVYVKGIQYVGPSGPSQNFTSVSISNNGETVGFSVSNNNPNIPM